jgi:hypothetical protein
MRDDLASLGRCDPYGVDSGVCNTLLALPQDARIMKVAGAYRYSRNGERLKSE